MDQKILYSLDNVIGPQGWSPHDCLAPGGGPQARDGHHVSVLGPNPTGPDLATLLGSPAQQRIPEVGQLLVCYVFDLKMSVKYLKVTFSFTQKSVKFRSVFIFLQECRLFVFSCSRC